MRMPVEAQMFIIILFALTALGQDFTDSTNGSTSVDNTVRKLFSCEDYDQDGYGNPDKCVEYEIPCMDSVCSHVPNTGDCDDKNPKVHHKAKDLFGDGVDQNCDGVDGVKGVAKKPTIVIGSDDAYLATFKLPPPIWCYDGDLDGFGDPERCNDFGHECWQVGDDCINMTVENAGDCDDSSYSTNPNAKDRFGDDVDQNCDGVDGNKYDWPHVTGVPDTDVVVE
jgi:hypothetical protein